MMNADATTIGLNRCALIALPKISASVIAGIVATITLMAKRC